MQNQEKKKLQKENNYSVGSGAVITTARLGFENYQILAAADDQKNLIVWKITKTKPKLTFSNHTSNVCSIGFDNCAETLFAGTEGGSVYVWNLNTQQSNILTGHKTSITSIAYEKEAKIIATASRDSNVKIWDLRASNTQAILTFQQHRDAVRDVAISPDGKWIASGGADGILKIWEIDTGKIVQEIPQHSPNSSHQITCLEYNPQTLTLACGSTDKKVKYWDLENFQNISVTTNDSSEILHLDFYQENSDLLFAASHDHVRLWNVETNKQLDCLSLPPKTITDMKIAIGNDSRLLLVSAIQKETISIYFSHLANINFDESIDMLPTNIAASNNYQQISSAKQIQNSKFNTEDAQMNSSSPMKNQMNYVKQKSNEYDFQEEQNANTTQFIQAPVNQPVNLDMSNFKNVPQRVSGQQDADMNPLQKSDTEIINECLLKHVTFSNVMQARLENISTVMNYILKNNDMQAAINAINMIKDTSVTMDILNSTFAKNKRMDMLNFQRIKMLMPLVQDLIDSKYETYNICGIKCALNILKQFQQSIISIKQTQVHGGVDLAREDRVQKSELVIDAYFELSKSKSFLKSLNRQGEISEVAHELNRTLQYFLSKTKAELE